jgi:hypothetical protein
VDKEIDTEETVGDSRGFSRRTLIKGGAILGGTIWVAPVIDSLTNKAGATPAAVTGSATHYCCSCWGLVAGSSGNANVGESDDTPPSVQDCVNFCAGKSNTDQKAQYTNYTWCGPSAVALTYSGSGLGVNGPGCYTPNGAPDTGCTTGVITYSGSGFTYTESSPASGTH